MIAIVDYGMGNLRSVLKAFEAVGADARVTSKSSDILNAQAVVLPGVGAFRDCMKNLDQLGLIDSVKKSVAGGKPFLGICLGLQVLFAQSEEFGDVEGLDLVPGKVLRFSPENPAAGEPDLKVPHMGWNQVKIQKPSPLFEGVPDEAYFYFVHSYYVQPDDPKIAATTTSYGKEFVSGIQYDNVHAFQFHPEKSQKLGLQMLRAFSRLN